MSIPFDPDWVVHPGATLRDWRAERGLSAEQAAATCLLTTERYTAVESGDEPISAAIAGRLASGTGISFEFWMDFERIFRDGLAAGKTWTR